MNTGVLMLHITFFLTAYILTITFVLGCCLGSFADCMAGRLLSGEPVFAGRSHCDHCRHVLGALDLVPVLSWVLLKGRCRYCQTKVPAESTIVELISGFACCLVVYRYDLSVLALRGILLWVVLLTLTLTDLHQWIIPDRLQVAGCVIFLVTALFLPDPLSAILKGFLLGIALGGGMLCLSLLYDRLSGKESLGGGDIKLFFMTGLYLGSAWEILFYLILSCLLGLAFALVRQEKRLPFGPAIAAACFVMLLYGGQITRWYTGLF